MVTKRSPERHFSTCIQLLITKHPSRKVLSFRHLLGCDTIGQNPQTNSKIHKYPCFIFPDCYTDTQSNC